MPKYKIGLIVTWLNGPFPDYFSAWLRSAEQNKTIDFHIFTHNDVISNCPNIILHKTTFDEIIKLFENKLNRTIGIKNSYKLCDCRAFFGLLFEDYLREYDYYGFTDIDLLLGDIRKFLSDDILEKYNRFYPYGHFNIFRNNDRMKNLYFLPGGLYSEDEIFNSEAQTTAEEHWGLNRICVVNKIPWYVNVDFADFYVKYPTRLEADHGFQNYTQQIFFWKSGSAYQAVKIGNQVKYKELVYMHFQKKRLKLNTVPEKEDIIILSPKELIVLKSDADISDIDFDDINPSLNFLQKEGWNIKYKTIKLLTFVRCSSEKKRMWIKQKMFRFFHKSNMYD